MGLNHQSIAWGQAVAEHEEGARAKRVLIVDANGDVVASLGGGATSVSKATVSLSSSGNALVPASGKKIRVYGIKFSLTADLTSVSFRFDSAGTDFEKYLAPKTGGLYGSNNHPDYVEGGIDQELYCVISGTGTIQINIDYVEL